MTRVIISDLDGTLLRSDKTISDYSINVLKKCKNEGNQLIFATARPPRDIYKYIPHELKNDIIICYNGALVIKGKDTLYKMEMPKKTILEIMDAAKKYNLDNICIEINDKLYSNFDVSDYFGKAPCEILDLRELDFTVAFKVIICTKESIEPELLKNLPKECRGVITDKGTLCQIMHSEVSKWNSIKYVINHLNCKMSDVIAFGDDYNDLEMIKNCGTGVAMKNAIDELKSVAKFVTKSNDEDGVVVFLENNKFIYTN
ncbi:HAD family hydrolase [Clostridium sp. UBA6640]|uniref:HAD family hydrolase n=1 Tax=Clostridium sp. UBA6640 TaxID=1946370 RepID=UPI0025C5FBBF|nr:HAD family hydrolase [Clostridium sp. UBA6640]